MRITKYKTELGEDLHAVLIKENTANYPCDQFNSPEKITDMLNSLYHLDKKTEEHLYMVGLNNRMKVLGVFEVAHGTSDKAMFSPREIFRNALLCNAVSIVLAHNHPSQDTTPSENDISMCRCICEAGRLIGINLVDNLIIGDSYYSFLRAGLIKQFQKKDF